MLDAFLLFETAELDFFPVPPQKQPSKQKKMKPKDISTDIEMFDEYKDTILSSKEGSHQ